MRPSVRLIVLWSMCLQTAVAEFVPARRLSGSLPASPPPTVVGWIDERFEAVVDHTGRIEELKRLRITPMPVDSTERALADWRFRPAVDRGRPARSRLLVAAMFRPPHVYDAPTLGTPPTDLATPSEEVPFPVRSPPPRYPPAAVGDAIVLVEVLVGMDGRLRQTRIVSGRSGFHQASLEAAQGWEFRPARHKSQAVESYSYLIFGFRAVSGAEAP